MKPPVFEEIEPAGDCDCPGCRHRRPLAGFSPQSAYVSPGALRGAQRAVVVAVAASAALGAGQALPAVAAPQTPGRPAVPAADGPDTPQGGKAPLHGPGGRPAPQVEPTPGSITRAEIINRAKTWVAAKVPYSMSKYWTDGYRQDCSGFVSMAWKLAGNEWTGSLDKYGVKISKEELQPGDMLLFHNPANPEKGSHVVIFGGWTDYTHTYYTAYESTPPHARKQSTPYAYWSNSDRYVPYRYKGVAVTEGTDTGTGEKEPVAAKPQPPTPATPVTPAPAATPFPGAASFGPGANNKYVTQLGQMLVKRGGGRFYTSGPGPVWTNADLRATQAFQQAQGWTGTAADGIPGPKTWDLLVTGKGRSIPAAAAAGPQAPTKPKPKPPSPARPTPASAKPQGTVPAYPGGAVFRPGADSPSVTRLGERLVEKGYGRFYATGPGPLWGEADRRAVEAFQRAQGWRGAAADGYPGPETWRRLFR
ncbi:peptidoglycan-binding protein [Streptomyces sp. NPDC093252]|uniref:peptidoglycan-binding protein n=1 Tax=Streptomyces sp. NPDC093252 TaxID=3154980 RepID=UPI00343117FC